MKEQFVKTKLCPYYTRGNCANGEGCSYAHSEDELRPLPNLQKTKLCERTTKGFPCKNANCTYAHSRFDLRTANDLVAFKTSLCFFHKKGRCLYGEKCRSVPLTAQAEQTEMNVRFAHGPHDLKQREDDVGRDETSSSACGTDDFPSSPGAGYRTEVPKATSVPMLLPGEREEASMGAELQCNVQQSQAKVSRRQARQKGLRRDSAKGKKSAKKIRSDSEGSGNDVPPFQIGEILAERPAFELAHAPFDGDVDDRAMDENCGAAKDGAVVHAVDIGPSVSETFPGTQSFSSSTDSLAVLASCDEDMASTAFTIAPPPAHAKRARSKGGMVMFAGALTEDARDSSDKRAPPQLPLPHNSFDPLRLVRSVSAASTSCGGSPMAGDTPISGGEVDRFSPGRGQRDWPRCFDYPHVPIFPDHSGPAQPFHSLIQVPWTSTPSARTARPPHHFMNPDQRLYERGHHSPPERHPLDQPAYYEE
eukprot:Polyplicarium_translucidae@DN2643_c0_g1_i4.p1